MSVRFLDLKATYLELQAEIDEAVARVLTSGCYIQGPELKAFEENFARYCGAAHCVGVSNGLAALQLALLAMDVGPGDEVIVASNTFIATWLAVSMVGAVPVPVEPDPETHNIDPDRIEGMITNRTKVLLPTHLYGQPADLGRILEIARRYGLRVLEDGAQAHGARFLGQRVGAHGDAVAWSFYPGKNLGAFGDAGAVTTNDLDLAARVRLLGNYGSRTKYIHEVRGFNSRLDPLQAAVLNVKLRYLDDWNARRAAIASFYIESLTGSPVRPPAVPRWANSAWHLFVVRTPERDRLASKLARGGIQTLIHYPVPPHLQQGYADMEIPGGSLPVAEKLAREVLSLPIGPHLRQEDAERVISFITAGDSVD